MQITPARGKILVKRVETTETLPNGTIIFPEGVREWMTGQQMEIVAVGAPGGCDDGDCERQHFQRWAEGWHHVFDGRVGDWVLLAPRSLVESGTDGLYFAKQDDVLAVLTT